jgi:hypothetical protein
MTRTLRPCFPRRTAARSAVESSFLSETSLLALFHRDQLWRNTIFREACCHTLIDISSLACTVRGATFIAVPAERGRIERTRYLDRVMQCNVCFALARHVSFNVKLCRSGWVGAYRSEDWHARDAACALRAKFIMGLRLSAAAWYVLWEQE